MFTDRYRLDLVGPFGLFTADGERIDLRSKKSIALIALLATAPSGVRTRNWLQAMLWGTRETQQAQSSLRRELANLAALFLRHEASNLLIRENQRVQLNLDLMEIDLHRIALSTDTRQFFVDSGDFLEGIDLPGCDEFEDWLRRQRARTADLLTVQFPEPPQSHSGAQEVLGGPLPPVSDLLTNSSPSLPPKPSVTVLPFKPTSGNGQAWLGARLAEEIGLVLTLFPQLFVVDSNAASVLDGRGLTAIEIADALGVRYILAGSVQQSGNNTRIAVRLLDAVSGQQQWTRTFEAAGKDLATAVQEITHAVAPQIWTQIDLSERHRAILQPIRDRTTYELYWRANALFREGSSEGTLEAIRLTDELVALNPACALSAALAAICNGTAFRFAWTVDPESTRRAATVHLQNALRLGAENVEAIGYAAGTLVLIGGDMNLADRLVGHALAALPNYQPTLFWGGFVDMAMGKAARARERLELSLRINPSSGARAYAIAGIGISHLMEGSAEKALPLLQHATVFVPGNLLLHAAVVGAAVFCGEVDLAREAVERVDALGGEHFALELLRDPRQRALLAHALATARSNASAN